MRVDTNRDQLLQTMQVHVVAKGELSGQFKHPEHTQSHRVVKKFND